MSAETNAAVPDRPHPQRRIRQCFDCPLNDRIGILHATEREKQRPSISRCHFGMIQQHPKLITIDADKRDDS